MIEKTTEELIKHGNIASEFDWYVNAEEYDKLATASKKILSAINKLPIGSFSLLEKEYENLKKILHG